jgi:hypothetical protein
MRRCDKTITRYTIRGKYICICIHVSGGTRLGPNFVDRADIHLPAPSAVGPTSRGSSTIIKTATALSLSPSPSRHTTSVRPQNRIKEQATGMREKRGPSSPLPPSQVTTHTPDGDAAAAEVCIKAQKISRSRLSSPPHPRCAVCVPSPRDCEQVLSSSVHPCPVLLVALLD